MIEERIIKIKHLLSRKEILLFYSLFFNDFFYIKMKKNSFLCRSSIGRKKIIIETCAN